MKINHIINFPGSSRKDEGRHVFHTDNRGCLLSYEGDDGEVTVPEGVKYIGADAFAFCSDVTGVILPEGVQAIAEYAFGKSGIRKISLPDSTEAVGAYAFVFASLKEIVTDRDGLAARPGW